MAGIADSPPGSIQVNSLSAINSQPDVNVSSLGQTAPFEGFMNAFRTGFITADDIRKRQGIGNTDVEAARAENIARKTGAEQTTIDLGEIRPKQRELAQQQLEGSTEEQSLLNRMNSTDTSVSYPAREQFANRQLDAQATAVYGTPNPDLYKSTEQTPEDFDTWVTRQANAFQGTDQARAEYVNHLREKGEQGEEYAKYKKAVKEAKVPIPKDTPEYRKALREHVHEALTYEQLQQINFDVMKEAAVARAKAQAELPLKQAQQSNTAQEQVLQERHRSEALKRFQPQFEAFNKVDEIKRQGNFNNATDISLLYEYVKLLDPSSSVREGELKLSESAVPGVQHIYNRFKGIWSDHDKLLDDKTRQNLFGEMDKLKTGAIATIKPELERIQETATARGVPISQVLTKPEIDILQQESVATPPATPPGVSVGTPAPVTPREAASAPVYPSLAAVPKTVRVFKGTDGKVRINPNFTP